MSKPMSLKLLIDTKGKRVLFAEAGKDFVDFLFQILALPLGTAISLLRDQTTGGSLTKLYESLHNLNNSYIQPNGNKDTYLKPVHPVVKSPLPLLAAAAPTTPRKVYMCLNSHRYYSDDSTAVCPYCLGSMTSCPSYVAPPAAKKAKDGDEGGVVRGLVTYMVMDDLAVTPLSTISSITLLNKFNVKDVGALEEKVVHLGMTEAVKLLNAALQSSTVLTDVFFKPTQIKMQNTPIKRQRQ